MENRGKREERGEIIMNKPYDFKVVGLLETPQEIRELSIIYKIAITGSMFKDLPK